MESNKTRTDLLNFLIEKHGFKSYLEIGLQNAAQNFDKIKCDYKVSVDPDPNAKADFCMTSDEFFSVKIINKFDLQSVDHNGNLSGYAQYQRFDLIFIDGLHTAEQVKKDFENALQILSPNGFIVLHDCNPLKEEHTIVPRPTERGHWNGDVYRTAICINQLFEKFVTVDIDCGCGVLSYKGQVLRFNDLPEIDWQYFDQNRKQLLNLISWDEFVKL